MLTTMVPGNLLLLAAAPVAVVYAQNFAQPIVYETVTVPALSPNAQVGVTTVALSTVTVFGSEPNSALATIVISPDGAQESSTAAISASSGTTSEAATSSVFSSSTSSAFPTITAVNGTGFGNFTNSTWPNNSTSVTLIDPTGAEVGPQESNTAHDGKPVDTAGNAKSAASSETHGLVNGYVIDRQSLEI